MTGLDTVAQVVTGVLVLAVGGIAAVITSSMRDIAVLKEQQQRRIEGDRERSERDNDIEERLRSIEMSLAVVRRILEDNERRTGHGGRRV